VDKGLRRLLWILWNLDNSVSILGLVDKGLRRYYYQAVEYLYSQVSILGLVDKGLRLSHSSQGGFPS